MSISSFHAENVDAILLIQRFFYEFPLAKCENHKISDIASRFSAWKNEIDMEIANKAIGDILSTLQKYNYFFNSQYINVRTGVIKNCPFFDCDKIFWLVAIKIETIFNRTSSGIYKLAFEKLITFFESRNDLPLQFNLPFSCQFQVFMLKIWMQYY